LGRRMSITLNLHFLDFGCSITEPKTKTRQREIYAF